jgi:predicted permease
MEMPLLAGRGFTDSDHETAPKVAVINEAAARRYLGNESAIGRRFGHNPENSGEFEVVGVLRDARYSSVREESPPTMYVPFRQARVPTVVFETRSEGDPARVIGSIREAIRQIDPNLPMMDVSTQAEQIDRRLLQERVFAQAYSLFGGLALLLAAVGLFGVTSYVVAQRTTEIGVRMALGARGGDVLLMVMRESMVLVMVGLAIGLAGAAAATRLVESQLFGIAATDVPTQIGAALVMVAVSALAGYLPARRASRVDPMVAFRWE